MKQRIKDGFLYFIYVLGAEYIGLLVADVSFIITKFFTPDHWHISLFIGANIGAIIAVYILCRRCGYKEADEGYKFTFKETIPFIIGIIVYILLNAITNYRNPSFFNSDFLAFLFIGRYDLDIVELCNHSGLLFLSVSINTFIKYPFMVLGYKSGVNKRTANREKLFSHTTD